MGLKIIAYHSNGNTDSTIVPIEIKYSPEITPDWQSMAFEQTDLEGVLDKSRAGSEIIFFTENIKKNLLTVLESI